MPTSGRPSAAARDREVDPRRTRARPTSPSRSEDRIARAARRGVRCRCRGSCARALRRDRSKGATDDLGAAAADVERGDVAFESEIEQTAGERERRFFVARNDARRYAENVGRALDELVLFARPARVAHRARAHDVRSIDAVRANDGRVVGKATERSLDGFGSERPGSIDTLSETGDLGAIDDRHETSALLHLGDEQENGVRADVDRSDAQGVTS